MKDLEKRVLESLKDDFKEPCELPKLLRMKRKAQLLKLLDTINTLYANDKIDSVEINGVKKIYVK